MVAQRILGFQDHYQRIVSPCEWTFTRRDLRRLMDRVPSPKPSLPAA